MKVENSIDGKKRKIIILHDTFLYKGGGERLILMMAKALDADIATGFVSAGSFNLRDEGFKGKLIEVSSEILSKGLISFISKIFGKYAKLILSGLRHIKIKKNFLFNTKFLKEYDTVILSGDCLNAVRNTTESQNKIYYCHTPPRYLYDLRKEYTNKLKWYIRPAFEILSYFFKKMYESDIKNIDKFLTNSKNTSARLKHFVDKDSTPIYPPVELDKFNFIEQGDYYLSFARLSSAKRIENIVKAFQQMPDKKLICIYGENDPQKEEIFKLGENYKNIEFVTCPGNKGFYEYIGKCIATIYIPIDEDFGMSPVESMAAGKPVLGVDEGGLKESIIHEKTGLLIPEGGNIEDIIKGINYLTPEKCLSFRENCEIRANNFSYEEFEKKIREHVKK